MIPICLIVDKNYIMPTTVLLESLKDNKKTNTNYIVYIISDNIDDLSIKKLENFSDYNFKVKVISVDNQYKDLPNINKYVTNAAFLKFDIPFLLPEYEKILYLDVDMLVLDDLSELYNTDLQDTYAGVVQDVLMTVLEKRNKELNLPEYFNSGMILFNAKKIKNENLNKKMLELYIEKGENFICHDQDVLNIIFNNNVTLVNPKYNWLITNHDFKKKEINKIYKENCNYIDYKNFIIIHYVRLKPWIYKNVRYGRLWLNYYNKTNNYNYSLKLKNCNLLKFYFYIRGKFGLKNIDKFIKSIKKISKTR